MTVSSSLAPYIYADEATCVENLSQSLNWDDIRAAKVRAQAIDLTSRVRSTKRRIGELESFLRRYGLDTEEGLALMTLAEALLRIPDAATADALIRDKMAAADWLAGQGETKDILLKAAGFGLSLAHKTLDSVAAKLGEPLIRKAMGEAIRMLGHQFVMGRTMDEALKNAKDYEKKGYTLSCDMLGEGARTAEDAQKYFEAYREAIIRLSREKNGHGLSVKLSALHPRYDVRQEDECVPALSAKLLDLAKLAAAGDMPLTVDAEETDRLEMSLRIIGNVSADSALKGWNGLGLAIQAYQKRCPAVIDHLANMARAHGRKLQVRLVKGAYWDAEIKRAQIMGLSDYPVYTRKQNTDLAYIACAAKLLANRDVFYPMFATHNAHTVAAVADLAGADKSGFEFQRLHGMGENLHDIVLADKIAPVRIYAPVGTHEDLLPYLVRRLLENGANSSFVNKILDESVPVEQIVVDPVLDARAHQLKRHPKIAKPADIYGVSRKNSPGVDLTEPAMRVPLAFAMKDAGQRMFEAVPLIGGKPVKIGSPRDVINPADHKDIVGRVFEADETIVNQAFETAKQGFKSWNARSGMERAEKIERFADLMERDRAILMHLCVREGGKTLDDAQAEWREAVDFCRYYAQRGRIDFSAGGHVLPGPTGESNILKLQGRGVFVCVSPWNFPLAIFTGQVVAALMAGNAVIAKPASNTPLVAMKAAELMVEAGIDKDAIALLPASGKIGSVMVAHKDTAGVAFTGSTEVAWQINRTLAAKDGPIVPLIAETGGQNAMLVDSSALMEQVVDDVIVSAFGSSGQRCSALRCVYIQDDVADKFVHMLKGAMDMRRIGNPVEFSTDTGPLIDNKSRETMEKHRAWLDQNGKFVASVPMSADLVTRGSFFPPVAYEIKSIRDLEREVFGPILHIVRYAAKDREQAIADINSSGFGLTFGLHTRIGSRMGETASMVDAGNVYINRTMIGAVVGVQPFGGMGLSGTGPKAGGPHYLPRFATEKVISTDTTRQGGNASLVSLTEE